MSPTTLAPQSFLEVPVNSAKGGGGWLVCWLVVEGGGGGDWVVAEEGVPGREGLGMGTVEPVFFYALPWPPFSLFIWLCRVCGAHVCGVHTHKMCVMGVAR